jgi:hypothetical protein
MKNYDQIFKGFYSKYKKAIKLSFIIGFAIIFSLIVVQIIFLNNNKIEETFNNSLSGVIIKKTVYKGSTWIKLRDSSKRYVLKFANNFNLKPSSLSEFIEVGDSIYKPANTDTLFIYRNNDRYLFILGNVTYNKDNKVKN